METQSIRRGARETNASTVKSPAGVIGQFRLSGFAERHRIWLLTCGVLALVAILSFIFFRNREPRPADAETSKLETSISSGPNQKSTISIPPVKVHAWPADTPSPAIAPFDAEKATQHQEAWAKYLNVPVEFTNSIGMKFRLIPPGEFSMGMTVEEAEAIATLAQTEKAIQQMFLSSAPIHRVV